MPVLEFPAPEYAYVGAHLRGLGFDVVGIEFVSHRTITKESAPDWTCISPNGEPRARLERQAWAEVRHAASRDNDTVSRYAAARAQTYVGLLGIRSWEVSSSYNNALNSWYLGGAQRGRLYSNGFLSRIDAAVHAFIADACCFRDLLAEMVSRCVLCHEKPVTTLSGLLKRLQDEPHPLAIEIKTAGEDGGWLKNLTELRNNIMHVAPVGRSSSFHDFSIRFSHPGNRADLEAPSLWYPLLTPQEALPPEPVEPDWNDEDEIRAALDGYWAFHQESLDGLSYLWRTFDKLLRLGEDIRVAAGFRREMPTITDDDVIATTS